MATEWTKEQTRKVIYARCQSIKRRLERAGVPVRYRQGELSHAEDAHEGFNIHFHRLIASDGKTSLLCLILVDGPDGIEKYDHVWMRQGINRIKQLFGGRRSSSHEHCPGCVNCGRGTSDR